MEEDNLENIEQPVQTEPTVDDIEATAEEQAPLRGRARLRAQFAAQNPDVDYDDDDNFDEALEAYDTDLNERLGKYNDFDSRIRSSIDKDPRNGQFMFNLLDGMDIFENLLDIAGPELQDIVNSPEARAKYEELRREAQELEVARQQNIDQSEAIASEFLADKDPADVEQFDDFIVGILTNIAEGNITRENIEMFWKAYKHDDDVAQSAEEGEIRGRNTRIVAERRRDIAGDGVPSLRTLSSQAQAQRPTQSFASGSIWERGKTSPKDL